MSEPDIAGTLYDHRLAKSTIANDGDDRSVMHSFLGDCNFFCTCFEWSTKTATTWGHAHQEWIHHIAAVLSGVYAITPLPVVSISGGNCDPLVAVREVLQSWDDGDYDAEGDFAPHHVVRHLRQALGDVS